LSVTTRISSTWLHWGTFCTFLPLAFCQWRIFNIAKCLSFGRLGTGTFSVRKAIVVFVQLRWPVRKPAVLAILALARLVPLAERRFEGRIVFTSDILLAMGKLAANIITSTLEEVLAQSSLPQVGGVLKLIITVRKSTRAPSCTLTFLKKLAHLCLLHLRMQRRGHGSPLFSVLILPAAASSFPIIASSRLHLPASEWRGIVALWW
jgi:hypothetical protein